jgi:hypothetical protein
MGKDLHYRSEIIIILACLGVAAPVLTLAMGLLNLTAPDAIARLSDLSVAGGNQTPAARPANPDRSASGPFVDLNYLREEITAREEESADIQRELDLLARQEAILKGLHDRLRAAADAAAPGAEGPPAGQAEATAPIADLNAAIRAEKARREEEARVDVVRWLSQAGSDRSQWIECVKGAVVFQPQGFRAETGQLAGATALGGLEPGSRATLLVRPSGFASCAAARKALDARGVRYSLEPVEENWQLLFGGAAR